LLAELLALGWAWFVQLKQLGKEPEHFPAAPATFAGRAVRSGRRLCGQLKAEDMLSPVAQYRRGFVVQPLPGGSSLAGNLFAEALLGQHAQRGTRPSGIPGGLPRLAERTSRPRPGDDRRIDDR
jgi:hypothetical protein